MRLDEGMTPYLFDLQEKFTSYGLYNILKMKSQYSIRFFEILKSYTYQKSNSVLKSKVELNLIYLMIGN
ncbi:RepB family plasmid replication initiator protein [Konateibacter massiliensis]|uniref:RepB family plasmid replication initiator protein n=1 Tax=Konateibacter massiliensis TaxID=2002841 RepID=UPI0038CBF77F